MAHGTPDWGMSVKSDIFSLVDDLAELPPRLGYPASVDRRGSVFLLETFDTGGGLCLPVAIGSGASCGLSADFARYGRFTYRMTKGAGAATYAYVYIRVAAVVTDKIGVEVHFYCQDDWPNLELYLLWMGRNATYVWCLRWDTENEKVYIDDVTTGWVEVAGTYPYMKQVGVSHVMKLVVDSDDLAYSRAFIDGIALVLPEASVTSQVIDNSPTVGVQFINGSGPDHTSNVYLDALILTRGEA